MNQKSSLYAVIGGVVGAVLTMAVCSVMPIGAQNGDATFGEITCTKLNVVDSKGSPQVKLLGREDSGVILIFGEEADHVVLDGGKVSVFGEKGGGVMLGVNDHGGRVEVFDNEVNTRAAMGATENGGDISVFGTDGIAKVEMYVIEQGGSVVVNDSDGTTNVKIGITERGGRFIVGGRDEVTVAIDTTEHGGKVAVFGKGDSNLRAVMSVNDYGNGVVNTWDKNGYRVGTLK